MKYHKLFNNHTEYESYLESSEYKKPCLAYCKHQKEVHYKKKLNNYEDKYFTIEALGNGNVYFKYLSFATTEDQRYMEYSKDGGETWTRKNNIDGQEVVMTIPLLTGETAFVRGDNDTLCAYDEEDWSDYYGCNFYSDINFNASGNIMSLIYGDAFVGKTQTVKRMFYNLFFDRYGDELGDLKECLLINASNLILPATTLGHDCYSYMFRDCISLTEVPKLPATTLANSCYYQMFSSCTSLTKAPELPATTLADSCYSRMFFSCTALTEAPKLPAKTLIDYCYQGMFSGCSALTTAPELPAITLASHCYQYMFSSCTNLRYIKAMFTTTPGTAYTQNWVYAISGSGTFVKNSAATWTTTGVNGVPTGWTVQTASA